MFVCEHGSEPDADDDADHGDGDTRAEDPGDQAEVGDAGRGQSCNLVITFFSRKL